MENDHSIKKWLNGEMTDAEFETFKNRKDYQTHLTILEDAKQFKVSNFEGVADFNELQERMTANSCKVKPRPRRNYLLRIASVIVLALGIYFTLFHNELIEVHTVAHQQLLIELPDASQVTLNALSEIAYHPKKWKKQREVHLNGEAYFKVQKGSTFDVITSKGTVTVVGTEFNVKQRNGYFEVACFEGIVKVSSNNIQKSISAGETFRILNEEITLGNTQQIQPSWTQNKSTFEKIPFNEVISELERQYAIKIELDKVPENRIFTGGFVHDHLNEALISVTQPLGLTYEIRASDKVVIYGEKR